MERFDSAEGEEARLLISGFHKGWDVDKYIKETGKPEVEVLTLLDGLERDRLIRGQTDYDLRPGFPVLREADLAQTTDLIRSAAAGIVGQVEANWTPFEDFVDSLDAGSEFPRDQILYRVVVGGVLFGGMVDALFDDKTLMPNPPRREGRGPGYYAWMTEGDLGPQQLVFQSVQVGRHRVFSVGPVAEAEPRVEIRQLAETGPVYEYDDARRWRVFASIMARDNLLPYMKSLRRDIIELHSRLDVARYTAVAEFMAWFYVSSVTQAAETLAVNGRISPPATSYRYALLADR